MARVANQSTRPPRISRCLEAISNGPVLGWVQQALAPLAQDVQRSSCSLTPEVTLWFTIALSLWRGMSVPQVFRRLRRIWRRIHPKLALPALTDGALAHARKRLGPDPLRRLFDLMGASIRPPPTFHGLRVWAIDGVRAKLPDTPDNRKHFGRPGNARTKFLYPQALLVTLCAVATRQFRDLRCLRCRTDERQAAQEMFSHLGPDDLLLMDRGIYSAAIVRDLLARGTHFVIRLPHSVKFRVLERLGPNDFLVEIRTRYLREGKKRRRLGRGEEIRITARLVRYRLPGARKEMRLLTDLEVSKVSALEIAKVYHQRWEIELAYDELKTHMLQAPGGAQRTVFRGKSPPMVEQEIWATFVLYNQVRDLMVKAARRARKAPTEMSFVNCLDIVRDHIQEGPAEAAKTPTGRYYRLLDELAACTIDRPRRKRQAPRVVREAASRFRNKQRRHKSRMIDLEANLEKTIAA